MLKLSLLFALITTLTVLSVCQAGGCKLNDKKLKKSIKKYSTICTSKGFQSSLGCPSTKMKMSSKQEKKCKKMEGKLAACDYSCEVTAAPTEPPTEPPTKPPTEPWTEPPTKKPEPAAELRERLPGEITPASIESSSNSADVANAIDMDLATKTTTFIDADSRAWLKVKLDKVMCIHNVVMYWQGGKYDLTRTCTTAACSQCVGTECYLYTATVSTERKSTDALTSTSACTNGDTVVVEINPPGTFWLSDLAITGNDIESNILNSKMVAAQKDIGWDGVPSRAIDGNTDGRYDAGSCTHSATNDNNWWEVHLDGVFSISKVVIFNREDSCCKDRINEAKVYAGEVYCGDVEYEDGKNVYEIDCGGTLARSIVIRQPNNILTLCEVQAFGKASNDECIGRHDTQGAAYRGTQSVTESGLTCQRWDSQTPNKHQLIPERYPTFGLEENYCRNPDGEPRPWCYNSERTSPRWEYCDIPTC